MTTAPTVPQTDPMSVTITTIPGGSNAVLCHEGDTVGAVLERAGINLDGRSVRADGQPVTDMGTPVNGFRRLVIARQIKGN